MRPPFGKVSLSQRAFVLEDDALLGAETKTAGYELTPEGNDNRLCSQEAVSCESIYACAVTRLRHNLK